MCTLLLPLHRVSVQLQSVWSRAGMRREASGFSLIELMVAVAVVGILAAVAYPSYQQYILRSNRATAQAFMMEVSSRQQQYFLANRSYATLEELGFGTLPADVAERYTCDVDVGTDAVPSFLITCSGKTGTMQASDGDLTLDNTGSKTPTSKW